MVVRDPGVPHGQRLLGGAETQTTWATLAVVTADARCLLLPRPPPPGPPPRGSRDPVGGGCGGTPMSQGGTVHGRAAAVPGGALCS